MFETRRLDGWTQRGKLVRLDPGKKRVQGLIWGSQCLKLLLRDNVGALLRGAVGVGGGGGVAINEVGGGGGGGDGVGAGPGSAVGVDDALRPSLYPIAKPMKNHIRNNISAAVVTMSSTMSGMGAGTARRNGLSELLENKCL